MEEITLTAPLIEFELLTGGDAIQFILREPFTTVSELCFRLIYPRHRGATVSELGHTTSVESYHHLRPSITSFYRVDGGETQNLFSKLFLRHGCLMGMPKSEALRLILRALVGQ